MEVRDHRSSRVRGNFNWHSRKGWVVASFWHPSIQHGSLRIAVTRERQLRVMFRLAASGC